MLVAKHVLAHLDGQSLLRVAGVSRWWRDVSEDDHVWHPLCVRQNIDTSTQIGSMHTFAGAHRPVDSSASPDTRFARVHAACPLKAVYMSHMYIAMNWCRRKIVVRTHEAGECGNYTTEN
jgi:hypothetical protein